MNLIAKYAGRVVEVKKPIDRYDRGEVLSIINIVIKDNSIIFNLEDNPTLTLDIPQGTNNLESWLGKLFKMKY